MNEHFLWFTVGLVVTLIVTLSVIHYLYSRTIRWQITGVIIACTETSVMSANATVVDSAIVDVAIEKHEERFTLHTNEHINVGAPIVLNYVFKKHSSDYKFKSCTAVVRGRLYPCTPDRAEFSFTKEEIRA